MTDAELVARAREGDTTAFGELVRRHQGAVYRAALTALGSRTDADDVAQEAFMLAYTRLDSFRGAASFKTWLLTIAWNQAINVRRSRARWWRRIVEPGVGEMDDSCLVASGFSRTSVGRSSETPEQLAVDRQLRRDIRHEILALSPKLRDALLLAQSGDYSYEEIGAMLKVPVGTIKWRVSEARKLIKVRLRARGYTHGG